MLFIRFFDNEKFVDLEVNFDDARHVHKHFKKKYGQADLIFKENDVEYCLM